MPICSSGISRAKAGVASSMIIDQQYIQNLLPSGLAWLYPYLPWAHGLEIGSVSTFCAAQPPTFTTPTAAEIYSFISQGPIGDFITVNKFIEDVTKYYLWFQLCECASVTTPAASAPPSSPGSLPAVNPGGVVALPVSSSCDTFTVTPFTLGAAQTNTVLAYDGRFTPTAQKVSITLNSSAVGSNHPTVTSDVQFIGAVSPAITPVLLTTTAVTVTSGAIRTDTYDIPQGTRGVLVRGTWGSTSSDTFTTSGAYYCGPTPTQPAATPCPPDPAVRQLLKQIYDLLTLVQRQSSPFSYVYGSSHTFLSGAGQFSVQGIIGVSVSILTLPSNYGVAAGNPDVHFGLGTIQLGTFDGFEHSRQLEFDGLLMLPPQAGAFTRVGYSLAPGVEVQINELLREPS